MSSKTIRACVMGYPLKHSLSPKLHSYWINKYKINGEYSLYESNAENLEASLEYLINEGFAGCNLTIPLKEKALPLMDELDDVSKAAGAVNTIVFKDGKKFGYNSDGFGFMESLKSQQPAWSGESVVILGTGGAARSIISVLKSAGAECFSLVNRAVEKAQKAADDLQLKNYKIYSWDNKESALPQASLLINCSCLGMQGCEPLKIDLSNLSKHAVVCDIVYRPSITPLLEQGRERGNPIVEGLPMLLHQGRLGFKHWFGVEATVDTKLYNEIKTGIE